MPSPPTPSLPRTPALRHRHQPLPPAPSHPRSRMSRHWSCAGLGCEPAHRRCRGQESASSRRLAVPPDRSRAPGS
eukprot:586218-Hanusia_phi.AAC.4